MAKSNELGKWGEEVAVEYLRKKGYAIRDRNWHIGTTHDIDIIATTPDEETIVFIEVKTRRGEEISTAEDAITPQKIRNLGRCANAYVKMNNIQHELRFDIIVIIGNGKEIKTLRHSADAFNPCLL